VRIFTLGSHRQQRGHPLSLAYDEHVDECAPKDATPLVIMHGLFGNRANWKTLSKQYAQKRKVYAVGVCIWFVSIALSKYPKQTK
jgi:hypothetical protein